MEVTFADMGRISVMAAFRYAVCHEMLEGRYDTLVPAVMLGACSPYHRSRHFRCQICVLSIGLFNS